MGKFNIGHIVGVAVNSTERVATNVRTNVPAAGSSVKGSTKARFASVKTSYRNTREGVVIFGELPAGS